MLEASSAGSVGYVWQGRYGLPLAAGVPIVAGILIARSPNAPALRGRLAGVLAVTFGVSQVLALFQSLRRNSVGSTGPVFFFLHPTWAPPVPAILILVGLRRPDRRTDRLAVLAPRAAGGRLDVGRRDARRPGRSG